MLAPKAGRTVAAAGAVLKRLNGSSAVFADEGFLTGKKHEEHEEGEDFEEYEEISEKR